MKREIDQDVKAAIEHKWPGVPAEFEQPHQLSHDQINHKHDAEEIQAYNEEERELWGESMAYPRTLTNEQIADFKRDLYGKSLAEKAKEYGIPPGSLCRYRAKIIKGKL